MRKRMKYIKKCLAAVLAAVMMISLAACSDTTWVFDYDGERIPSGLYIGYTMAAYNDLSSQEGYDTTITDPMKQTVNGMSAKDWIKQEAKASCARYVAIARKFEEMGLSLTEEDQAEIDSTVNTAWAQIADSDGNTLGEIYEDNGVSQETYEKMVVSSAKMNLIFEKYYGTGGLEEVAAEDLYAHFKENFASINALAITLTSGDDLTEEQIATNEERQEKIDQYISWINEEGKTFADCYDDYYHYILGTEHSEDEVLETDEDLMTWITRDSTSINNTVLNAVFNDMQPDGTASLVKDGDTNFIVVRYDVTKDEKNFEEMRDNVLADIKGDEFNAMLEEWAAEIEPTVNGAAVNRYDPKNIHTTID